MSMQKCSIKLSVEMSVVQPSLWRSAQAPPLSADISWHFV